MTKSELGGRKASDIVYECTDMDLGNFEIVNDGSLLLYEEYCRENSNMSYLSWLEDTIIKLRERVKRMKITKIQKKLMR